jgi:hypothetical protein
MKRIAIVLAPLAFASAAFAQTTLPEVADTDGNGTWSLVELQAVWTDLTEETFTSIDTGADGEVDQTELQAALDGGVITVPEATSGG